MVMDYGIFPVTEVFVIKRRGVVASGRVEEGTFQVGDDVLIVRQDGSEIKSRVNGIELFGILPYAEKGDMVGLLLAGISMEDVASSDIIKRGNLSGGDVFGDSCRRRSADTA